MKQKSQKFKSEYMCGVFTFIQKKSFTRQVIRMVETGIIQTCKIQKKLFLSLTEFHVILFFFAHCFFAHEKI